MAPRPPASPRPWRPARRRSPPRRISHWAADQFNLASPVWIGLSDSGTEGTLALGDGSDPDETLWAPASRRTPPSKDDGEDFAALLPGGQPARRPPGLRTPRFLLQWDGEGAQPRHPRQAAAARTGAALQAPSRHRSSRPARATSADRAFSSFPQSGTWDQASGIATAAGGHLAVPSNAAEAAWITEALRSTLGPAQACWIGGRRNPGTTAWEFATGEKFEFVDWAPEQHADGQRLGITRAGGESGAFGYHAANDDDLARYLLIEWSAPSHRNMPDESETAMPDSAPEWLASFRRQTYDRNKTKYERFIRRWNDNIDEFIDDVNSEIATAKKVEVRLLEKFAKDFLKTVKENGRIPNDLPAGTPPSVRDIHEKSLDEQRSLWADFKEDFEGMSNKYLEDVLARAGTLERRGDADGAGLLMREHAATGDDEERMHAILQGESPPVPAVAQAAAGDQGPGQKD